MQSIRIVLALIISLALSACGGGGEGSEASDPEPVILAPSLSDISGEIFIQGQAFSFDLANNGGEELSNCSSTSAPSGVTVSVSGDTSTCVVSGTLDEVQAEVSFDVTAINSEGESTAQVSFSIRAPLPYVTSWRTDNRGDSDDNQITLHLNPDFSYNFSVNWGDGNVDNNVTNDITHTYDEPGDYQVTISGVYPAPFFPFVDSNDGLSCDGDGPKLLSIDQWGDQAWLSMVSAFCSAENLVINDSANPVVSQMYEDLFDDLWIFDTRDDFDVPLAALAGFYIDIKNPFQPTSPIHRCSVCYR